MKDFHNLRKWEKSYKLSLSGYGATEDFPRDELYGITNQTRRASSSISASIAEGCGKDDDADLRRSLLIAMGSSSELENYFLIAKDLGYLKHERYEELEKELLDCGRCSMLSFTS